MFGTLNERHVLERVLGRQLKENQQVINQVVTVGAEPPEEEEQPTSVPVELPEWCRVYDGLTDSQIAAVEETILQRSDFTRPSK